MPAAYDEFEFEVEQKFRVADHAAVEAELRAMGAAFGEPQVQVDRYYKHPTRDFARTDEALRVREVSGDGARITYKGPKLDATTKTRREIEFAIAGADAGRAHDLLSALSFEPVEAVCKERREASLTWEGQAAVVSLDRVDRVGTFVEVELHATAASLEAARASLESLRQRLALTDSERRSYLELLLIGEGSA